MNLDDTNNAKKDKSLELLIKKNIELSEEILSLSKYIKKYVFWRKVFSWLKLFIIVIPIAIAFIYLPPFLKELYSMMEPLMGVQNSLMNIGDINNQ